jgi:uncharacterized membrane protein
VKATLLKHWDALRSSFWFIPALMALGAVALAFGCVALDETTSIRDWLLERRWTYTGGAEGASLVLSTIAGSMVTIAGVVFSMTLVALSLASSQLGPRLLRNFMRDTANQVVLGTFIACFVYCLLVLRTIRLAEESSFVPHLSVSVGVAFALASLGVLIYFIHHVSVSIQANDVVARVAAELFQGIDRQFAATGDAETRGGEQAAVGDGWPDAFDAEARTVPAAADGYLQFVDTDALVALANREDLAIRLERRPGQYVVAGAPLMSVWPGDRDVEKLAAPANAAVNVGHERTAAQDIEFAVHQLVEIAVRALSPGINDPFTAITCVDRLGSGLFRLTRREMPASLRFDANGRLRVVVPGVTFAAITDAAFHPIRQYARSSAAVTLRLLDTIALVATATQRAEHREALLRHAEMIVRGAREALPEPGDRADAEARYRDVLRALAP